MSIQSIPAAGQPIGSGYQNQAQAPEATVDTQQETLDSSAEINQLNAEIKQAESEIKETAKEVQKAVAESIGGSSEKVQMLQNKMQMQQQQVLMKQLKIQEMQAPSKAETQRVTADISTRPRMDQYVSGEAAVDTPDNVYHVEEKDGARTIVFNRSEQ